MTGIQVFTACDPIYFHEYAIPLAYSLNTNSPNNALHLHIFGYDSVVIDHIYMLQQSLKNTTITWSYEKIEFPNRDKKTVYCSCVRFIRLSQLIPFFNKPILSLDTDSLIISSIDNLPKDVGMNELALRIRLNAKKIEHKLLASTIYLQPTLRSQAFFKQAANAIFKAMDAGTAKWYLDQVSFYEALKKTPNLKVQDIALKYADFNFSDDACIWAGKGTKKELDTRYKRALGVFRNQSILDEWQGVPKTQIPNFAIIGAMKAGTTSLYAYLSEHPDIYFSNKEKEPGYFLPYMEHKRRLQKNIGVDIHSRQQAFQVLMPDYQGQKMVGDASVYYTQLPSKGQGSHAIIHAIQPNMKFIYVLRHPIERILSHYFYHLDAAQGTAKTNPHHPQAKIGDIDFNQYIEEGQQNFIPTSLYALQLSSFFPQFAKSQFLILTSEELKQRPHETLKKTFEFLSVDSSFTCQFCDVQHNTSYSKQSRPQPKFKPELYRKILKFVLEDVAKLEQMFDRKFDWDFSEQKYVE
ncbi:sulfotransferase domain-containing protein [Candidatus Albibeggiatoa sp. nov. NOAA]|uniref:sulfotransferase domain-containing protein n=1 Tax=Candidatus Albibeggiatoa sp. nov. NOAA TaxID=3162724 RepID=UPI0033020C61|nr:sulfotransferase [Thiotrichaceae bacterium]